MYQNCATKASVIWITVLGCGKHRDIGLSLQIVFMSSFLSEHKGQELQWDTVLIISAHVCHSARSTPCEVVTEMWVTKCECSTATAHHQPSYAALNICSLMLLHSPPSLHISYQVSYPVSLLAQSVVTTLAQTGYNTCTLLCTCRALGLGYKSLMDAHFLKLKVCGLCFASWCWIVWTQPGSEKMRCFSISCTH